VSACPVTIHAILHIPDSIEASGPVWVSWAFPTERYCGSLVPAIRSRRFPFPSLDRYIAELAQLTQIKMLYNLEEILSLQAPKGDVAGLFSNPACEFKFLLTFELIVILTPLILFILIIMGEDPECVLLPPCILDPPAPVLYNKIAVCLSTRFDLPVRSIRQHIENAELVQYAKIRFINGGDIVHASTLVSAGDDRRDASFLRVSTHPKL
jgi:hypothetical protein